MKKAWQMTKAQGPRPTDKQAARRASQWGLSVGNFLGFGPWALVILALRLVAVAGAAPTLTDLTISPSEVRLATKRDRQSLVVQAAYADGVTRDAKACAFSASVPVTRHSSLVT